MTVYSHNKISAVFACVGTLLAVFGSPSFALSSAEQKQMDDEVKQGQQVVDEIAQDPSTHLVTDKSQLDRVNQIGQRLAAVANTVQFPAKYGNDVVFPFTWHFRIIKSTDVNAFALPGGNVYIYSALLNLVKSDDELAGVLAHEITHSAHHHAVAMAHAQSKMDMEMAIGLIGALLAHVPANDIANVETTAQYAALGVLNTKYGQSAEKDADHTGVLIMQKAGYNPLGMLSFMMRLHEIEDNSPNLQLGIFKDHPYTDERLTAISAELAELKVNNTPSLWREVTGAARAEATLPVKGEATVTIGEAGSIPKRLFVLSDPDGTRAHTAADQLNKLLDSGLQLSQVRSVGPNLIAADTIVISISASDADLDSGHQPSDIAADACHTLRNVLYAQQFMASRQGASTNN